jgi:catechol 2,3-dioxygenase-like lactoylglutathione lyase family enzyme
MTIEINGMAHVILTASRFEVAREFYRKLLPEFGMKPVFDGNKLFYCVGARTAIGIEPCEPALAGERFVQPAGGPAPPLSARPFARGRRSMRRSTQGDERDHCSWPAGGHLGTGLLLRAI